jgi:hypothetical protein
MVLALVGLGLGLIGAAAAGRVLRSLLFDTAPLDPFARGAARVDPLAALRAE